MTLEYRILELDVGWVGFVASSRGLRRMFLPEKSRTALERSIRRDFPEAVESARLSPELARDLTRYFAGERVRFAATLDFDSPTDFDVDVWRACARIPYGKTKTYAELASAVGRPAAARAVGTAMGRNPCPIIVPCHRVIRSDGSLGGYSGALGVAFKHHLLEMEGALAATAAESAAAQI